MITELQQELVSRLEGTALFSHIVSADAARPLAEPYAVIAYAGEECVRKELSLVRITRFTITLGFLAGNGSPLIDTVLSSVQSLPVEGFSVTPPERNGRVQTCTLTLETASPW